MIVLLDWTRTCDACFRGKDGSFCHSVWSPHSVRNASRLKQWYGLLPCAKHWFSVDFAFSVSWVSVWVDRYNFVIPYLTCILQSWDVIVRQCSKWLHIIPEYCTHEVSSRGSVASVLTFTLTTSHTWVLHSYLSIALIPEYCTHTWVLHSYLSIALMRCHSEAV